MTDRELMQQVLDALFMFVEYDYQGNPLGGAHFNGHKAIEALRARLAQPEPYAAQAAIVAQQTQGRMSIDPVTGDVSIGTVKPQREWKTLTDEEITACIQMGKSSYLDGFVKPLATSRAVEAKLKEKNGF